MVMSMPTVPGAAPRRGRGLAVAATAAMVAAATVLSGCSITEKRNEARLITTAQKRLVQSGTALLSISVREKVIDVEKGLAGQSTAVSLGPGQTGPARNETVVTNFPLRQALVITSSGAGAKATNAAQYFNDGIIYQRQPNIAASSHPWLQLNYESLYDSRKRHAGVGYGYNLLNPLWVVDLLRGTLTGSIKRVGPAQVGEVVTTEYAANFAWDKSLKGTGDQHSRAVQSALTLLGVPSSIVRGNVWLDATGNVRQMQVSIREHMGRHNVLAWHYTIQFAGIGQAVTIALPKPAEVARVDSLGPIANAWSAASSTLAAS